MLYDEISTGIPPQIPPESPMISSGIVEGIRPEIISRNSSRISSSDSSETICCGISPGISDGFPLRNSAEIPPEIPTWILPVTSVRTFPGITPEIPPAKLPGFFHELLLFFEDSSYDFSRNENWDTSNCSHYNSSRNAC